MRALLGVLALALLFPTSAVPASAATAPESVARAAAPSLKVTRQVRGLENPWDVKPIGKGELLITERDTAHLLVWANGSKHQVRFPSSRIWVSGETGLMSLEIDPKFDSNRRFYTCSGWVKKGGGHDVRVVAWKLSNNSQRATKVETLLGGFPTSTGRHGGCRLLIAANGSLLVGTGDAAQGTNPRNLKSLGGKTLRLNRMSGKPWRTNRWVDAANRHKRYIHTFGHRNVQGLAQRKDGSLWSVEHGPTRDDEVNKLRNGGDYGWHPVPGYNEDVPMTDQSLPGKQYAARWSSGSPTLATSGAAWVHGRKWGRYNGTLAVAALKANRIVFMKFDRTGHLTWTKAPKALRKLGRLRSVTRAPNNDLLLTSDNDGGDAVIRVSPN